MRAAEAAYRSTIPAGVRPSLVLEITLPVDIVDVNVHPAKAEVRFRDRWPVERAVEHAVRRALGVLGAAAAFGARVATGARRRPRLPVDVETLVDAPRRHGAVLRADLEDGRRVGDVPSTAARPSERARRSSSSAARTSCSSTSDGVVLIDQHSAHERVLFERFMAQLERGRRAVAAAALPDHAAPPPAEAEAFEEPRDARALGFEIEGSAGTRSSCTPCRCRIRGSTPQRACARRWPRSRRPRAAAHARHERLVATVACKAAIKAGDALSAAEMRALFVALAATTLPAHDVHGRSTIVQLSWDELERRFGRR